MLFGIGTSERISPISRNQKDMPSYHVTYKYTKFSLNLKARAQTLRVKISKNECGFYLSIAFI